MTRLLITRETVQFVAANIPDFVTDDVVTGRPNALHGRHTCGNAAATRLAYQNSLAYSCSFVVLSD